MSEKITITIPRCQVARIMEKTSKAGKAYKQALVYADGGSGLLQVFLSDDAQLPPVNVPLSIQFFAEVGFQGDLRFAFNKDTKFKAL